MSQTNLYVLTLVFCLGDLSAILSLSSSLPLPNLDAEALCF